jgi:hypothetical protein
MTCKPSIDQGKSSERVGESTRARLVSLRAALAVEARVAEVFAQRERAFVGLLESLTQRALALAHDKESAGVIVDGVFNALRSGLAGGEIADDGDFRMLAEETLAAFEFGTARRITLDGPPARLDPEACRLVAMALFDLASRSQRFGALAAQDGRVSIDWKSDSAGRLCLTWRDFASPALTDRRLLGMGGGLDELLASRFGCALRQRLTPFGMVAEMTLPPAAVRIAREPAPRRVLVALDDTRQAAALSALLAAGGVCDVVAARDPARAAADCPDGAYDLVFLDGAHASEVDGMGATAVVLVASGEEGVFAAQPLGPVLRLPSSTARVFEVISLAMSQSSRASV